MQQDDNQDETPENRPYYAMAKRIVEQKQNLLKHAPPPSSRWDVVFALFAKLAGKESAVSPEDKIENAKKFHEEQSALLTIVEEGLESYVHLFRMKEASKRDALESTRSQYHIICNTNSLHERLGAICLDKESVAAQGFEFKHLRADNVHDAALLIVGNIIKNAVGRYKSTPSQTNKIVLINNAFVPYDPVLGPALDKKASDLPWPNQVLHQLVVQEVEARSETIIAALLSAPDDASMILNAHLATPQAYPSPIYNAPDIVIEDFARRVVQQVMEQLQARGEAIPLALATFISTGSAIAPLKPSTSDINLVVSPETAKEDDISLTG